MIKILALLLLLLAACGRAPQTRTVGAGVNPFPAVFEPEPMPMQREIPSFNRYTVMLEVDPSARAVQGLSQIEYTNRTDIALDTLVMRIYLNAFGQGHIPPVFSGQRASVFVHGSEYARMDVQNVAVNGESTAFELEGTVLTITPSQPINPNQTVQISLQFDADIPMIAHRTGANEYAMWMGKFLPVMALATDEGWHVEPYYAAGDPFLLEAAHFDVSITTPIGYTVAGTGTKMERIMEDTVITRFTANMSRDFAFAISSSFNTAHTTTQSGTVVHLYYYTDYLDVDMILEAARLAMEYYEDRVGAFPYRQISIVEVDLFVRARAFSQVVFVDSDALYSGRFSSLSHQLARQWFPLVVATDPFVESWLAGGLSQYMYASFTRRSEAELAWHMERDHSNALEHPEITIANALGTYATWQAYATANYNLASLMMHALALRMGMEEFWAFINAFYREYSFGIASGTDFIRMAQEAYGEPLDAFFEAWLWSDVLPPLRVE